MKKMLLHMCCMPCSLKVIENLESNGMNVTGFSYNPNIHPEVEYLKRKETVRSYMESTNRDVIFFDEYNMKTFIRNTSDDIDNRCIYCYNIRIEKTARYAKENGFDCFTTSLLISPYQKHDMLVEICKNMAKKYNIEFYYADFRPLFREGQTWAKELELYRQKFCGCIYSIDSGKWDK